jgi:hypothetical protein
MTMRDERRFRDARPEYDDRRHFEDQRRSAGDPYSRGRMRDLESEDDPGEPGRYDEEWEERRFRGRDRDWNRGYEDRGRGDWDRSFDRQYGRNPRSRFGELGDEFDTRPAWRGGWGSGRDRGYGSRSYGSFYGGTRGELRGGSSFGYEPRSYGSGAELRSSWGASEPRSTWGFGETGMSSFRRERMSRSESFAGRGPKGYARSDERIREDVSDVLMEHPEIDAGGLEVSVMGGTVTLTGTTTDRRTKRLAEDVVEDVTGVKDVQNQIRVTQDDNGRNLGTVHQSEGREASKVYSSKTTR